MTHTGYRKAAGKATDILSLGYGFVFFAGIVQLFIPLAENCPIT